MALIALSQVPASDLYTRAEHLEQVIEQYIRDVVKIPEALNFKCAHILACKARENRPIRAGDLRRLGFYLGSNAAYNTKHLIEAGYLRVEYGVDKRTRILELTEAGRALGADIALQLNFIEEQIGNLFSPHAHQQTIDFLTKTVFGSERPRSSGEIEETA